MKNSLWQNASYFCSTAGPVSISVHSKLKVIVQVDVPVWSVCHCRARALDNVLVAFILAPPTAVCVSKPADRKLLSQPFFIVTVVLTSHWQTQSLTSRLMHLSILLISAYNLSSAALSLFSDTPDFLKWLLSIVTSATLISFITRSFMFMISLNQSLSCFAAQVVW